MFSQHDLAVFVTVADRGSIRLAATALSRTQPAVSQAIQRLEHAAGFALFDRSGYRVALTPQGQVFLKRARAAVAEAQQLKAFADLLARGTEPSVRIAVHGAIPPPMWSDLVTAGRTHFPDTVLELQAGEGDSPLQQLLAGKADLALLIGEPPIECARVLELLNIGELDFVNVIRRTTPSIASAGDPDELPQIVVSDFEGSSNSYGVVDGCRHWRVSNHRIKLALIEAGAGWGTVPQWMAEPALQTQAIHGFTHKGIGPHSRHPCFIVRRLEGTAGPVCSFIWEQAAMLRRA